MISFGDMLDTLEKNTPQETTVEKKKEGDSEPEKKDSEPEKETDDPEDVI